MKVFIPCLKDLIIHVHEVDYVEDFVAFEKMLDKTYGECEWFYSFYTARKRLNYYIKERNEIF